MDPYHGSEDVSGAEDSRRKEYELLPAGKDALLDEVGRLRELLRSAAETMGGDEI